MQIINARIFRGDGFESGTVIVTGDRIEKIENSEQKKPEAVTDVEVYDASGYYIIPGLIDIHFHGCMGDDFSDGSAEALRRMLRYELHAGVTAVCPTAMSYPEEVLTGIVRSTAECENSRKNGAAIPQEATTTEMHGDMVSGEAEPEEATLLGIRLEGPFLNPGKAGAQDSRNLHKPDAEMLARLQDSAAGRIRICDFAPELADAGFIKKAKEMIPVLSVGHTCADYEKAAEAFSAGAALLTHCYNAMPGIHHRMPGPILAAWEKEACAELICDGVHVHPSVVRATFRLFGAERIILVSDSTRSCGMPDGCYTLGGQEIVVDGRKAVLREHPDTLAGSSSNLMQCLRRAVLEMQIPPEQAVRAATVNPARLLGAEKEYGSLEPGHRADMVVLDENLQVVKVMKNGRWICT